MKPATGLHRAIYAALLIAAASATISAQTPTAKATVARIVDSLAKDFIATNGAPGVSIAVVRGRDTLVMNGWGLADLENNVPATAQSVYEIGSLTKQFTASAVMQLVEQQRVKLDDSIGTYLSTLPAAWRVVTVRELLNHTSGIPSYTDVGQRWIRRWGEEMTPDTLVALTASDSMMFKPGTSWRYDNSGYIVLGMLVEKLSGKSRAENITDRFSKPLDLHNTLNCATTPIIPHRAHGYQPATGSWENPPYLAMSQPYAAGALCSTVGDVAKWDYDLGTGKVVSAASYTQMTTPTGAAVRAHYGFGLIQGSLAGHAMITHDGGIPGFASSNAWFPGDKLAIVVLSNSEVAKVDALLAQVARAALGAPLLESHQRVAVSVGQLARYVGVYALKLGDNVRDFTVVVRDGVPYGQLAGQGANPLIPYGHDSFGMSFDPNLLLTFVVADGRASKVILNQNGGTYEGLRK
ncbi:MAG: serine hydrolase domain-containing protein [Gemmatimonadaceae bacterium]